jgi:hypothetical protein
MRARMRDGVLIEFHCVQINGSIPLCEPRKRNHPALDLTNYREILKSFVKLHWILLRFIVRLLRGTIVVDRYGYEFPAWHETHVHHGGDYCNCLFYSIYLGYLNKSNWICHSDTFLYISISLT